MLQRFLRKYLEGCFVSSLPSIRRYPEKFTQYDSIASTKKKIIVTPQVSRGFLKVHSKLFSTPPNFSAAGDFSGGIHSNLRGNTQNTLYRYSKTLLDVCLYMCLHQAFEGLFWTSPEARLDDSRGFFGTNYVSTAEQLKERAFIYSTRRFRKFIWMCMCLY